MKRECLLSKSYTGNPMVFLGVELFYSPLVNEILREFQTALFAGDGLGDQTHQLGMAEGIYVMHLLASGKRGEIARIRKLTREERHSEVLDFYLENEDAVDALKPEIIARLESAAAAAVESEGGGKSRQQPPESSQ